jgi:hypothetical protein
MAVRSTKTYVAAASAPMANVSGRAAQTTCCRSILIAPFLQMMLGGRGEGYEVVPDRRLVTGHSRERLGPDRISASAQDIRLIVWTTSFGQPGA